MTAPTPVPDGMPAAMRAAADVLLRAIAAREAGQDLDATIDADTAAGLINLCLAFGAMAHDDDVDQLRAELRQLALIAELAAIDPTGEPT